MAFKKGTSGNPSGRPHSLPFKTALEMEIKNAGADHKALRSIARKLIDEATDGNMTAINAIADRLDGKPVRTPQITMDGKLSDLDAAAALSVIADAVVSGELTPQEGQQIGGIIESKVKAVESKELERRITELEKQRK